MRAGAKATARRLAAKLGAHVSRQAPPDRVRRAIRRLAPRDPGIPLIPLGGPGDGGYLVPDDLGGIVACFSPGVSTVATFEEDLAERFGIRSFLADFSVDRSPSAHPLLSFEKRFLGPVNDAVHMRLDDWVAARLGAQDEGDLLLQMDIEGAEWPVLVDASATLLRRFRVIVLELHDLDALFSRQTLPMLDAIFAKLTAHHAVVHLHPNNCCGSVAQHGVEVPRVLEVTLLRTDRVSTTKGGRTFPHPLDAPNLPGRPDLPLPRDWWA